jgi:multicomponent Na+:H+ antiporter subunit F
MPELLSLIGLLRVLRGPGDGDRMLAMQLLGTTGVGILLLLSPLLDQPALVDVALILALLAAVATAAFTGRQEHRHD